MPIEMPKKSRLKLPPVTLGQDESLGERIARLRKESSITQQELAERIGTIQDLISDYERDRLRVTAEMVVRIAEALGITADEPLTRDSQHCTCELALHERADARGATSSGPRLPQPVLGGPTERCTPGRGVGRVEERSRALTSRPFAIRAKHEWPDGRLRRDHPDVRSPPNQ
jgi:transcriptional regulator with XRE-family HTH domain